MLPSVSPGLCLLPVKNQCCSPFSTTWLLPDPKHSLCGETQTVKEPFQLKACSPWAGATVSQSLAEELVTHLTTSRGSIYSGSPKSPVLQSRFSCCATPHKQGTNQKLTKSLKETNKLQTFAPFSVSQKPIFFKDLRVHILGDYEHLEPDAVLSG